MGTRRRHPSGSSQGGQFAPDRSGIIPPTSRTPISPTPTITPTPTNLGHVLDGEEPRNMITQIGENTHTTLNQSAETATPPIPPPYHKRFKNFNVKTLDATHALMRTRPSQLPEPTRKAVFEAWITEISNIYHMEKPKVIWDDDALNGGGGYYRLTDHSITLAPTRPSIITLIHEMRHALQFKHKGSGMVSEDVEIDARAWSLSLYYKTRPKLFTKLVKQGKVFHITESDL